MLDELLKRGVRIPAPQSVEISADLNPDLIDPDVTIHAGCKLSGPDTLIMAGCRLGREAPVTVANCQLGRNVHLNGGYFRNSTFLDGANMGSGAQVRDACLLEEEAGGAHNVGLKQTILFPFVTLGSQINFCDIFMAGGTSRKDHSEVGSSYIHFNYTPNQDKATASLVGDVPGGVMLDRRPIFLGGQGGLVGPARIAYGTVVAAGSIVRRDILDEDQMVFVPPVEAKQRSFTGGLYGRIETKVDNSVCYIANMLALRQWYLHVRSQFYRSEMEQALLAGALDKIDQAVEERIARLGALAEKLERSVNIGQELGLSEELLAGQRAFCERWTMMKYRLGGLADFSGDHELRDAFLAELKADVGYIEAIKNCASLDGRHWLQSIVDGVVAKL